MDFDGWIVQWIRNWLVSGLKRVMVSGPEGVAVLSLWGPYWHQYFLMSSSVTGAVGWNAPSSSLQMTPS